MKRICNLFFACPVLFLLIILNSCANSKRLVYFANIPRDSISNLQTQTEKTVIQKNDILKITITSLDEQTTKIFNSSNFIPETNQGTQGTGGILSGYLVDDNGSIKLPLVGVVKAQGLTKDQLVYAITNEIVAKKFAIDPLVSVRIINYRITVLGEVARPGIVSVINERITLPEALGSAGDLTPYGRRDNILLIREVDGKRIYKRFSLNDDQLFNKEFYYLQNQDILYVEPNNARAFSSDRNTQLIPIILSSISVLAIVITQLFR